MHTSIIPLIVVLVVAALIAAVVAPIAIGAFGESSATTATQGEGDTTTITGDIEATVDDIDDEVGEVTATVEDTDTGDDDTVTVSESDTETATVDGTDIDVTVDSINTDASMEYDYPSTAGWSSGASALWAIIDVMIVLGIFGVIVAVGIGRTTDI